MSGTHLPWLVRLRWGAIVGQISTITFVHTVMAIGLPLAPLAVLDRRRNADQRRPGRPGPHAPPADRAAAGRDARRRRRDPDRHPVLHRRPVQPVQLPLPGLHRAGRRRACARVDLGAGRPVDRLLRRAVLRQRVPERSTRPARTSHTQHMQMHMQGMWVAFGGRRVLHRLLHRARPPRAGAGASRSWPTNARTPRAASGWRRWRRWPPAPRTSWRRRCGTIAVVAKELRAPGRRPQGPRAWRTSRLIRAQVDRCRAILDADGGRRRRAGRRSARRGPGRDAHSRGAARAAAERRRSTRRARRRRGGRARAAARA